MTRERYVELLAAGPRITAGDRSRLTAFRPKVKPLVLAVHMALRMWGRA